MNDTTTIELDVCYDATTLEAALVELTEGLESITYRVTNASGPGGGWPEVRFEGSEAEVTALVRRYDPHNDAGLLDA